jgi:hypothetical protein
LEQPWKRVYVEIPEGTLLLSSMCTFHFGARFPLVFSKKPVPINLFHMRLRRLTCPLAAKPKASLRPGELIQGKTSSGQGLVFFKLLSTNQSRNSGERLTTVSTALFRSPHCLNTSQNALSR